MYDYHPQHLTCGYEIRSVDRVVHICSSLLFFLKKNLKQHFFKKKVVL
jgi:Fe-S oxidoreductase